MQVGEKDLIFAGSEFDQALLTKRPRLRSLKTQRGTMGEMMMAEEK